MSGIQTLATLVLGGAFDATELGENDIQPDSKLIEELQQRLVTGTDDVYVELIDRAELDRVTAERDALQERLNAADQRIDEMAAAAEPFAMVADLYAGEEDDSFEPARDAGMHEALRLTLGQFRALNDLCTKPLFKS